MALEQCQIPECFWRIEALEEDSPRTAPPGGEPISDQIEDAAAGPLDTAALRDCSRMKPSSRKSAAECPTSTKNRHLCPVAMRKHFNQQRFVQIDRLCAVASERR